MYDEPMRTATMTKAVTNTKLAVATAMLFVAGGVALAATPMAKTTTTAAPAVATIESSCSGDTIYLSGKCAPTYKSFSATCFDGYRVTQTLGSCKDKAVITTEAKTLCAGRRDPRTGKIGLNGLTVGSACPARYSTATSGATRVTHAAGCWTPEALAEEVDIVSGCTAAGQLLIQTRNTDTGFDKERIALAGSSFWAGKLKMTAVSEDIRVNGLKLTSVSGSADSIQSVCLYRAQSVSDANRIGCATAGGPTSSVFFFDGINETIMQGIGYWYVYAQTAQMDDRAEQTADSHDRVSLGITSKTAGSVDAQGVRSGTTLTFAGADGTAVVDGEFAFDYDLDNTYNEASHIDDRTASTTNFWIAGTRINDVSFVSSYGGNMVDTVLAGTGSYTVAILKIQTDAAENTSPATGAPLATQLSDIRFDISRYVSTTLSGVTIERIGGIEGPRSMTLSGTSIGVGVSPAIGTSVATLLSLMPNDSKINPGDAAYYVVKATVSGVSPIPGSTDWVRFNMNDLKGTYNFDADNNIDWFDGNSPTAFHALLLDTVSLTGATVSE